MKIYSKILLIFTILITSLFCFAIPKSYAGEMSNLAHLSYDSVMQYSASSLVGTDYSYGSDDESFRQKCNRFLCLEKPSVTKWQSFYIYSVIDIDGSDPTKMTYTTAYGSSTKTSDYALALAYISAQAELNDSDSGSYSYSKAYSRIMNNYLRSVLDTSMPYGTDDGNTTVYQNALDYMNSYLAGTATEVYSARIIVFQGGSMQTTAMLYGKVGENEEKGEITVNKYISNKGSRSNYSESSKKRSPENFGIGETVTYTIELTNTYPSERTVSITDTFEGSGTYGGLKISSYSGWRKNSSTSYSRNVTIPGGSTEKVTLSVTTYSKVEEDLTSYDETYMNKVTISGNDVVISKSESADYVNVGLEVEQIEDPEPTGSLQKYITAVNGESVHGRVNRQNSDKNEDPVVVKQGDIITYKIVVKNTSNLDIYNCYLNDILENGLSKYGNWNGLDNFSMDAGDEYETTIQAKVDASNMYLYNLENEVKLTSAKYTKEVKYRYTCILGCSHTFTIYIENVPVPSSVIDSINSGNQNKDYVRLKELIIAGTVWVDSTEDGSMGNEVKLEGIPVILHNLTDGTTMEAETNGNGYYSFSGFYKGTNFKTISGKSGYYPDNAKLKEYYVEFKYNGITYEPTVYAGKTNVNTASTVTDKYKKDSNATEYKGDRENFNNSLETISYNKGSGSAGTKNLSFEKSGHVSKLEWTDDTTISSYSFIKDTSSNVGAKNSRYNLFLSSTGYTDYLEYINLGLVEREKVDLSTTKDLYSAQVRVNEHTMDYDYNLQTDKVYYTNPKEYNLYIYQSDYDYRYYMYKNNEVRDYKLGKNTELEIDLTYRIRVYNESPDKVYTRVNEVIDFNSSQMTIKSKDYDGVGNVKAYMDYNGIKYALNVSTTSSYNTTSDYAISGYETNFITGMESIILPNSGKNYFDIYVTYSVDKDKTGETDPNTTGAVILGEKANIAQIGAYSTYKNEEGSKIFGLVDTDSNAGNVTNKTSRDDVTNIGDTNEYEDNTCKVVLDIGLKGEERTISGMVFEDARSVEVTGNAKYYTDKNTSSERSYSLFTGDGNFDGDTRLAINEKFRRMVQSVGQDAASDIALNGMTVQLIEIVEVDGKLYEETIDPTGKNQVVVRTTSTDGDGKYKIESYLPGTYIVRFKYGDILNKTITTNSLVHNGQDYKSTTYTLTDGTNTLESTADNDVKYNELIKAGKSDARDNEFRRIEIMAVSEIMTNEMAEFLKYTNYTSQVNKTLNGDESVNDFSKATNGFADTVTVTLGVEEKAKTYNAEGKLIENVNNKKDLTASMQNIDFGVVFRPENMIELVKKIKNITLTTSAGEELINIEYNQDGSIKSEVGGHNVQAINNTAGVQGFRYISVDEEILQGATLAVEYYIMVDNIGEVDIVNELLIKEEGSAVVLGKLENARKVIQSATTEGIKDNYIRLNDLFNEAGYGSNYNYGLFVSDRYYRGALGNDTGAAIVTLRVNKILDFIDNDASFLQINNNIEDKYWATTTEVELLSTGHINSSSLKNSFYEDKDARRYTTDTKNNLVVNVSSSKENPELVKNIIPEIAKKVTLNDSNAYIVVQMDAILAGDNASEDMVYENIAEVIEFYTPAGRRTNFATTIGNLSANDDGGIGFDSDPEPDTYGTEVIRLTPPTGLTRVGLFIAGNQNTIAIITIIVMLLVIGYIIKFNLHGKIGKSKFYK